MSRIWTHIKKLGKVADDPPEILEAKAHIKAARVELLHAAMKQQRRAYELRRELVGVALETISRDD